MNECWRWHISNTLACFGRNFVCHVTYLPISPQGRPRFELFLPRLLTAAGRIQNCTYRKIITYQTPQSKLPIEYWPAFFEQCQFPQTFPLGDPVNASPEWVFSLTKITHNLQVTINFKEMDKKKWEQTRHVIGDGNSTPMYNVSEILN